MQQVLAKLVSKSRLWDLNAAWLTTIRNIRANAIITDCNSPPLQQQGLNQASDVANTRRGFAHLSSWENLSRGDLSVMAAELFFPRRIFATLKLCLRGRGEPKKSINQSFGRSWTLTSLEQLSAVSRLRPTEDWNLRVWERWASSWHLLPRGDH